jgi:rhodanese-related sulfurtransferase
MRRELVCMICKIPTLKKLGFLILTALLVTMTVSCDSQILLKNTGKIQPMEPTDNSKQTEAYHAVCYDGNSYIAVGTNGRIDRIKSDKTVTNLPPATTLSLNDVISVNGTDIAVGDVGIVLVAKDGENFKPVKSKTTKSLYSITVFKETFFAAGAGGTIIYSSDGKRWTKIDSGIKNDILSITANERMCMAITRESQILMSNDGKEWSVLDYNKFYDGLAEPCLFRNVYTEGDMFFVTGEHMNIPGSPAIMSTYDGELWIEHAINMINDKLSEELFPITANAIAVDTDQLVVACNDGKLLTVTDCSTCNKLDVICDKNINDLVAANGLIVLVGDEYWFDIFQSGNYRQYSISAAQALEDYNNGAYIVDVRSYEDYSQLRIKGSIHIPLDKLEVELERLIPDRSSKIIFYCAKGVKSQTALEKALLMGYDRVYNLGGIDDWPYDTETGNISGDR